MKQEENRKIERLFRENYAKLYRIAYSFLREEETSRDIVSRVFAKLCESKSAADIRQAEAFLFACVRNECYNEIRGRSLHEKLLKLYPTERETSYVMEEAEEELLNELRSFIEKQLHAKTKQIFLLKYDEGKTYKETAEICGVSVSAVNKHIVKALHDIREHFVKGNNNTQNG